MPIEVDCREMIPPEPFTAVTQAMAKLGVGESVLMVHRRQPYPLYAMLNELEYPFEVVIISDGEFHITIQRTEKSKDLSQKTISQMDC